MSVLEPWLPPLPGTLYILAFILDEQLIDALAGDFGRRVDRLEDDSGYRVGIWYLDEPDRVIEVLIPDGAMWAEQREAVATALDPLIMARDPRYFR